MEDQLLPWVTTAISLGGTLVGYGMIREKVSRLEKDFDDHKEKAVTIQHFQAVIDPLKDTMREMRDDVKKLLNMGNHSRRHDDDEEE